MKLLYVVADQSFALSGIVFTKNLAAITQSSVTLLYISSDNQDLMTGMQILEQARESISEVNVNIKLQQGDALEEFCKEAGKGEYDLVVLESRRRRNFWTTSQRTFINHVIEESPVSVLLVRHANIKLEKMLVCTGGQEISEPVIQLAARLGKGAGLEVTLLYVSGAIPSIYAGAVVEEEALDEALHSETPLAEHLKHSEKTLADRGVDSETKIRHGVVIETILDEAHSGDFDLIVMGASHSKKDLSGFLMGDITQDVINRAKSAVLIVK